MYNTNTATDANFDEAPEKSGWLRAALLESADVGANPKP